MPQFFFFFFCCMEWVEVPRIVLLSLQEKTMVKPTRMSSDLVSVQSLIQTTGHVPDLKNRQKSGRTLQREVKETGNHPKPEVDTKQTLNNLNLVNRTQYSQTMRKVTLKLPVAMVIKQQTLEVIVMTTTVIRGCIHWSRWVSSGSVWMRRWRRGCGGTRRNTLRSSWHPGTSTYRLTTRTQ